jgi:hypothetical protein
VAVGEGLKITCDEEEGINYFPAGCLTLNSYIF